MSARPWQEVVREKCDIRQKLVEPYLTDINGERAVADTVLNIDNVEDLTSLLASGKVTAHDVTASYIRRLDQYYQQQGKLIGPLHGVPVTLKDQFDVKGADSTIGYVARAFKPAARDAAIVQILKSLGAIIIAKTNLPQSIMWCETENPLWGLTTNPRNPAFTPGGSTGGEGVLLALKASMIGWGTDIGGSIRIPSHMNGLWGLKPTYRQKDKNMYLQPLGR
ncbi:hypothetical protein LTR40_008958 [Exophiala xenobiotica]|nr:hypothetical protein LTR40_008958 [Exophiala xenobiotica]